MHAHACMHAYLHTYIHTYTYTYIYVYIYMYMFVFFYMCIRICICLYLFKHRRATTAGKQQLRMHTITDLTASTLQNGYLLFQLPNLLLDRT